MGPVTLTTSFQAKAKGFEFYFKNNCLVHAACYPWPACYPRVLHAFTRQARLSKDQLPTL